MLFGIAAQTGIEKLSRILSDWRDFHRYQEYVISASTEMRDPLS